MTNTPPVNATVGKTVKTVKTDKTGKQLTATVVKSPDLAQAGARPSSEIAALLLQVPASAVTSEGGVLSYLRLSPGRLVTSFMVISVIAVLACAVQLSVVSHLRGTIQTIGLDTKPSIIAAARIGTVLSNMDAESLNDALEGSITASGTSASFLAGTRSLSALLIEASGNVTFKDTEVPAIDGIQRMLPGYYGSLGEVRAMALVAPWTALQKLKWSSRVNRYLVGDFTAQLSAANYVPMFDEYKRYVSSYVAYGLGGVAAGIVLIGVLVIIQVRLSRVMRGFSNPFMALATIILVAAQCMFVYGVVFEHAKVRTAKEDAMDSLLALHDVKQQAYRMNADESMWLLDPDTREETAASFRSVGLSILSLPTRPGEALRPVPDSMLPALLRAEADEKAGNPDTARRNTPAMAGGMGKEMANITFGFPERHAATQAVIWFRRYQRIDAAIRMLEEAGMHQEAVQLNVGKLPGVDELPARAEDTLREALASKDRVYANALVREMGQSNWAFGHLSDALDEAISVNDKVFDTEISSAMNMVRLMPWLLAGTSLTAVALCGMGLLRRIRDYS